MYGGYFYPYYRSPFITPGYGGGYGLPGGYGGGFGGGFGGYPYGSYSNTIGSAIANQNMNVVGPGAIGGIQTATPTVIW
jgi:hypothetical protein